jgi:hypothetical protein
MDGHVRPGVCVCVCVCVFVREKERVCVFVRVCSALQRRMDGHVRPGACVCVHDDQNVDMHTYWHFLLTHTHMYILTYTHTYIYTLILTHIYILTHTYSHTHTHTRTQCRAGTESCDHSNSYAGERGSLRALAEGMCVYVRMSVCVCM